MSDGPAARGPPLALRSPIALRWPLALAIIALASSACVTVPPSGAPPLAPWAERQATLLRAAEHFTLNGRLAASNGSEGFSAGVRWQQQGRRASVELTGPLGFGAAHIQQNGDQLSITRGDAVTARGESAAAQLRNLLGFEPPLHSLRYWVLGVDDPSVTSNPTLDAQRRLVRLQQGGWQIDYQEYMAVGQQWLPRRLTVTHANLRLRLVINAWQL